MGGSDSLSYRQLAADVRRDAQETLRSLRAERLERRRSRKPADEPSPRQPEAPGGGKPRARPRSEDAFPASPETVEIVARSNAGGKRKGARRKASDRQKTRGTGPSHPTPQSPASLENEIDQQLAKLTQLCADAEAAKAERAEAAEARARLVAEADAAEKALNDARKDLEEVHKSLGDARDAVDGAMSERRELRSEIENLTRARKSNEDALAKLETTFSRRREELNELETKIAVGQRRLDELNGEVSTLDEAIETARREREALDEELPVLRRELDAARTEHARLTEEAQNARTELGDISERLAHDEEKLHRMNAERAATEKALVETLASFSRERRKLENLKLQITEAGRELAITPSADQSAAVAADVPASSSLRSLPDIGDGMIWHLQQAGIDSLKDLASANTRELRSRLGGLGDIVDLDGWVEHAKETLRRAG